MNISDLSDDEIQRRASWSHARSLNRRDKIPFWAKGILALGFLGTLAMAVGFFAVLMFLEHH